MGDGGVRMTALKSGNPAGMGAADISDFANPGVGVRSTSSASSAGRSASGSRVRASSIYHGFGFLPDTICGYDTDNVFSYSSPKTVVLRDRRLGLLNVLFRIAVFGVVVGYSVFYLNGYLQLLPPRGTVQLGLRNPTLRTCVAGTPFCTKFKACCDTPACTRYAYRVAPLCTSAATGTPPGSQAQRECFAHCAGPPCVGIGSPTSAETTRQPGDVCYSNFATPLEQLPYCTQRSPHRPVANAKNYELNNLPCVYWDGAQASHTHGEGILMTTRTVEHEQVHYASPQLPAARGGYNISTCGCYDPHNVSSCAASAGPLEGKVGARPGNYTCPAIWHSLSSRDSFIADFENFVLTVQHTAHQVTLDIDVTSTRMNGWLAIGDWGEGSPGNANAAAFSKSLRDSICRLSPGARTLSFNGTGSLTNTAPCMLRPNRTLDNIDYFTLGTLLGAAGLDLDAYDATNYNLTGDLSVRASGAALLIDIEYINARPFYGLIHPADTPNQHGVTYLYKVSYLNASASVTDSVWSQYPVRRMLVTRNGVQVFVVQGGQLGKFNFSQLILTLTTALTYLVVADTIVRLIAQYMLQHRKYYTAQLNELSPDFSDVSDRLQELKGKTEDELREMCRARNLPPTGDKARLILRLVQLDEEEGHGDAYIDTRWCSCIVHIRNKVRRAWRAWRESRDGNLLPGELDSGGVRSTSDAHH